MNKK
jgi:hypothetical protein